MNILNEMSKIYEMMYESYQYVGSCVDSFDSDTGECVNNLFSDVSEFANYDELANCEDIEDSDGCGKMDREEFLSLVNVNDIPLDINNDDLEYHYYNNGVLVVYDADVDVHYFFSK